MSNKNLSIFIGTTLKNLIQIETEKFIKVQSTNYVDREEKNKSVNSIVEFTNVVLMYKHITNDNSLDWILSECDKIKKYYSTL